MVDLYLVLIYAFLYIVNSYGLGVTAGDYTKSLGIDESNSGYIQAAQPFFGVIGNVVLNYVTRTNKYRAPVLIVNVIFIFGNVFYSLAENAKKYNEYLGVAFIIIGRGLLGIGGARLMSRKFLSLNIQTWA
jgi:MFS family permease